MPKKKGAKAQTGRFRSVSVSSLSYENGRPIKQEDGQGHHRTGSGSIESEEDLFDLSDSPVEDFADNADGNEWPVERVVRFEVDMKGRTK